MKAYIFLVLSFLLIGQLTLSEEPSKDPNLAMPASRDATEADSASLQITNCPDCSKLASPSKQAEQLVINWDEINSRYSFSSLPADDQKALLVSLKPEDYETLAQRFERRLNLDKVKKPVGSDTAENLKDVVRNYTGGFTGKIIRENGKPKGVRIEYKKKF
ncbi:hypothetical protein K2P97_12150 [bacterium]|nr:hypothetical protein [bacterium]